MESEDQLVITVIWHASGRRVTVTDTRVDRFDDAEHPSHARWHGTTTAADLDSALDGMTRISNGPFQRYQQTTDYMALLRALDIEGPGRHEIERSIMAEVDPLHSDSATW